MNKYFLIIIMVGFQNLWVAGIQSAAPDTTVSARINSRVQDSAISLEATCGNQTIETLSLHYQFVTLKKGPAGNSQTTQSNHIVLSSRQKQKLATMNLKISARDTIISSLQLFNADKLIAADSLVFISGDSTSIKSGKDVYRP